MNSTSPSQPGDEGSSSFFHRSESRKARSGTFTPGTKRFSAGHVLGGFRLLDLLGAGGMGEVWEAEELKLGRRVALKLVLPDRISERSLGFFAREARAGGRLSHSGIVSVHGFGESDGVHWINQELVEGGCTLRDFLDDARNANERPSDYYHRVAEFVSQMADALETAHQAGVIHRDIKPQNILISPDDRPVITDFGLAMIADETALSQSGDLAGTYLYMSPEQVQATRAKVGPRSDVFSLGIVLYEMLSLQRPFEGDTTVQIADKIVHADPPDLMRLRSRLPRDLAVIAGKALEKHRDSRYQSMAELSADLQRFLGDEPILASAPGPIRRSVKWTRRHPIRSSVAGVGIVALSIISLLLAQNINKTNELFDLNRDLASEKATVQIRSDQLARNNKELLSAQVEIEAQRDDLLIRSERLLRTVDFQEGLFENLSPELFGARIRVGILEDLQSRLREQIFPEAAVETRLAQFQPSLDVVNFTNIGSEALTDEILEPAIQS